MFDQWRWVGGEMICGRLSKRLLAIEGGGGGDRGGIRVKGRE